jgi:5-enolpyruvylshikimate-3-phosphate synthase
MGASVRFTEKRTVAGEETATIVVMPRKLSGIRIGADDVPSMIDELPLLACVAAASGVDLDVSGAEELRVKESDRIDSVAEALRAVLEQSAEQREIAAEQGRISEELTTLRRQLAKERKLQRAAADYIATHGRRASE